MSTIKPDYLSRDYDATRASLLQYASQIFPEWNPASEGDFGLVLLELFSYMADINSYYTDRAQFENYLPTATQRDNILNLAYMLGYIPNSGAPATGNVSLTTDKGTAATTVPAGTQITTNRVDALDGPVVFETVAATDLPANPTGAIPAVSVPVVEGTTESFAYLGASTGLPAQTFVLPNTGVYRGTIQIFVEDGTGTTIINPGESQVAAREWIRVDKLLEAASFDNVFESRFTGTSTSVYFGDDINGVIPATGLRVYATFRHGYGAQGNVAPGAIRLINAKGLDGLGAVKVTQDTSGAYLSTETSGGADPESDDSIRYNAPRVYRTQNRAVTRDDFVEIALGTPGVTKASVISGTFTSVTIYVCGPDGGPPSETIKQTVMERLDGKTLVGVDVQVAAPNFVRINLGTLNDPVRLNVGKAYSNKNVKAAVVRDVNAFLGSMPFNTKLTVGDIYKVIMNVEGVFSVDISSMVRADSAQTGTTMITPRAWEVFTPGTLNINAVGGVA